MLAQIKPRSLESTHKGVNQPLKYITQVQQRPELLTVTLTWHTCKYKVPEVQPHFIFKISQDIFFFLLLFCTQGGVPHVYLCA